MYSIATQQSLQQLTVLSATDKSTHSRVKLISTTTNNSYNKSIHTLQRIYDPTVHGIIYALTGDSHTTKLYLPKQQGSLHLIHPYLLLQIYVRSVDSCHIELICQNKLSQKKRVVFNSNYQSIVATPQYTIYPLNLIQYDLWNNLVINLSDICTYQYKFDYYAIHTISIGASCKLRRIATLQYTPYDTSNDITKYSIQQYNNLANDTEHIHKDIQYPIGVNYVTQVIDLQKIHAYAQYNNITQHTPPVKRNNNSNTDINHNNQHRPSTAVSSTTTNSTHQRRLSASQLHIERLAQHREHAAQIASQNSIASIFSPASEHIITTPIKARPVPKSIHHTIKRNIRTAPPVSKSAYTHAASKRIEQLAQPRQLNNKYSNRNSVSSEHSEYHDNEPNTSIDTTLHRHHDNQNQQHATPKSQKKLFPPDEHKNYDSSDDNDNVPMSPIVISNSKQHNTKHSTQKNKQSNNTMSQPSSPISHATFSSPKLAHSFVNNTHINNLKQHSNHNTSSITHQLAEIRFTPDKTFRRLESTATTNHIDQVNLQYDPILECYFDPITATYYKLK